MKSLCSSVALAAAAFTLLLTCPAFPQLAAWAEFRPPGGRCSVLMPGVPKDEVSRQDSFTVHRFRRVGGQVVTSKDVFTLLYRFEYVDFDQAPANRQAAYAVMDDYVKRQLQPSTPDVYRHVLRFGYPACEFTARTQKVRLRGQAVMVGRRLYNLCAVAHNAIIIDPADESPNSYGADVENFLNSLKLEK